MKKACILFVFCEALEIQSYLFNIITQKIFHENVYEVCLDMFLYCIMVNTNHVHPFYFLFHVYFYFFP